MKKIGLIGGIGPESTVDYYRGLIRGFRQETGRDEYPEIVIDSINMTEMLSYVSARDWDGLARMLLSAIQGVADAGAEIAAIASNTPHVVFDRLRGHTAIPLVSIVEATCRHAKERGYRRVLMLGTIFTMQNDFYIKGFEREGIEAVVPGPDEQVEVQNMIFPELEEGIVVPAKKRRMIEIAEGLVAKNALDAVVLGCTELPLMIGEGDTDTPILNTTAIHVRAILAAAGLQAGGA